MALMPVLQINMGQQLKLTPQLQQSIKILQYSALEVQQTIATTLESNFMLELDDEHDDEDNESIDDLEEPEFASDKDLSASNNESELNIESANTLSDDLSIDCEWEEIYSDSPAPTLSNKSNNDDYTAPENYTAAEVSLHEKLRWQSEITTWQPAEAVIAEYLIDNINDEGFLQNSLEELYKTLLHNEPDLSITLVDVENVLTVIQQFDPTGVGAQNLPECLILQLKAAKQTPYVVTAIQLIKENFELLTNRDFKRIKKIYLLDDDELMEVIQAIQSMSPRPGRAYSSIQSEIVIPDLRVFRHKNGFMVELNQNAFPRLSINSTYIDMANNLPNNSSSEGKQIKDQLLEAKGLIKSIKSRGETLLRVGRYIIEKQARFLDEGEQAMYPMVLRDVAESLDLHESTISRATNQKYIQTPRGTFELKYFFSTGVSQYGNEDQSAIAIKSHIKQLIETENPSKPLSDNKLMSLLEEKEINVARRTIAKYRESMNIPSSSERKKMHQFN